MGDVTDNALQHTPYMRCSAHPTCVAAHTLHAMQHMRCSTHAAAHTLHLVGLQLQDATVIASLERVDFFLVLFLSPFLVALAYLHTHTHTHTRTHTHTHTHTRICMHMSDMCAVTDSYVCFDSFVCVL